MESWEAGLHRGQPPFLLLEVFQIIALSQSLLILECGGRRHTPAQGGMGVVKKNGHFVNYIALVL